MKIKIVIAAMFVIGMLSGCDNRPVVYAQPQVVQQQPGYQQAPVVVQHDNSAANLATGMMLGHMMSNGQRSNDVQVNRTVVNKTVIVNNHSTAAPVIAAVQVPPIANPIPVYRASQSLTIPAKAIPALPSTPNFARPNTVTPTFVAQKHAAPTYVAPKPSYTAPAKSFTTSSSNSTSTSSFKR